MNKILRDILTGIDGESFAIVKILGFTLVLVFIGLEIAAFCYNRAFDANAYGVGSGLTIAALGAAMKLTEKSEPGAKE